MRQDNKGLAAKKKEDGILKVSGKGKTIWTVGISGSKIAWGNIFENPSYEHKNPLQKYFDLEDFKLKDVKDLSFNRILTRWGAYSLNHAEGGPYGESNAILLEKMSYKGLYLLSSKRKSNKDCTKDNVLDALDWLEKEATQHNLVVVFVAGHGINDDHGNYYYLNYEVNPDKLRRTAVKWREFEDLISDLNSKVLSFVDTHHAGNIYLPKEGSLPPSWVLFRA